MAVQVDPLRNTLDHLALDPKAKDDRRYLVSMLRRLGYTDAEIEEALGPVAGKRVIEVEYGAPGHVGAMQVVPAQGETTFSVVQEADEPEEVFEELDDWQAEWLDEAEPKDADGADAEAEADDAWPDEEAWPAAEEPEEEVTFLERSVDGDGSALETGDAADDFEWPEGDGAVAQAEERVAFTIARGRAPDPVRVEAGEAGSAVRRLADDTGGWILDDDAPFIPRADLEGDPALDHGWRVVEDEADQEVAPEAPETPLEAPDEPVDDAWRVENAPGDAWAPSEEVEPSWQETVEEATEAPAFRYDDYTLYTRMVELSTGRQQRIYFFAKNEPKSGAPCALPEGYLVEQNERTGLPFLRRDVDTGRAVPQPVVSEAEDDGAWDAETWSPDADDGAELVDMARCHAVTQAGTQCKRNPRENSKYCGTHKGWRGQRVA